MGMATTTNEIKFILLKGTHKISCVKTSPP